MARRDRFQGGDAIAAVFTDSDEDAGRERDREFSGPLEGLETSLWLLVRGAPVTRQVVTERLDHHALAGRHTPEERQFLPVHRAGVGVGEESGFVQHQPRHRRHVLDRRPVAVSIEPVTSDRVPRLRILAQGEKRLVTTVRGAFPGDRKDLIGRHVRRVETGRRLGEGAVSTLVPAQHGEWDEHLR